MPVVRLVAFARLRELLGDRRDIVLADGASVGDLWEALVREEPRLTEFARGTRFARNNRLCSAEALVCEGDEIALLPPFGGG
ncbi:MAG: MoaD/ThiS family protein [Candidatus Eremiobacteraeota bacterium]|nr:MoaD/ThiS family protein [Candidatus Eremiobacteraeota bacterium]NNM93201.1 MoaD/ThiS family protein [Candidatus Eremiobacteraeota bacterium]